MHHTTYRARSQFRNSILFFHVYTQKKLVEQCFNITYLGLFSNTVNKEAHMLFNTCSLSERSSWSKHCPQFDNIQLKCLPIDNGSNSIRSVPNACFTRVSPTRIDNPRVVLFSLDALSLLNIRHEVNHLDEQNCIEKTGETNHLVEYLSGNKLWPGSDPTAHCYCGYQFGSFAGQLGDGAAISLGEVINKQGERWELQLKGSGLTPFSRQGDGRKVLRSSLREFLCSEAMYYLGIPTTRAASIITSDTLVQRDMFYTGDNITEKASITSRVAKTFIRFGSFEISKSPDPITGRFGPSVGNLTIVSQLTNYVIQQFYPHIWSEYSNDIINCYVEFFKEVVKRTANLVALWQTVGFCHGVLNTDNMSIIGLTIDYGPFGFIDQFTWDHISNTSDPNGRYSYAQQPSVCAWNLARLAECLIQALIDQQKCSSDKTTNKECIFVDNLTKKFTNVLDTTYLSCFKSVYLERMRKKLGLLYAKDEIDTELIQNLFNTMEMTGADFTNTFLALEDTLSQVVYQNNADLLKPDLIVQECCSLSQLQETFEPTNMELHRQLSAKFTGIRENIIDQLEETKILKSKEKEKLYKELEHMTEQEYQERNKRLWSIWLQAYEERLKIDFEGNNDNTKTQFSERLNLMQSVNPRVVLRNYLAEEAIKSADKGDYTVAQQLFNSLTTPFKNPDMSLNNESFHLVSRVKYRPPDWSRKLRVSCSS
ncbi:unnamed protein product [Schistosoma guineensis]|nr:unnamed protein product [Schistosoma guineensis]